MSFFNKLKELALPISIGITLLNILAFGLVAVTAHDASFVFWFAICVIALVFEILVMKFNFIKFIVRTILKGWKIGWNIGIVCIFIPGVNFVIAIVIAIFGAFFGSIACILALLGFPFIPILWNRSRI